jgi:1-acyl-sn-glycerol-3-phosphate acyltransferase
VSDVETFLAGESLPSRAFYQVVRAAVAGFCRVWMRATVEGRENVPTEGAFILAPAHRSNMDTPIAACVTRRRLRYMGKDTLWKKQPYRWLLSSLGGFPVTRGSADREALKRCIQVLQAGEPLVLFPEGERKSGPLIQPLFDGAAYVASRAQVPIVPVGIGGSERVMPKGAKFIYPRKVHLVIGKPLAPATPSAAGRVPREAVRVLTEELHAQLQELFDTAQVRAG